MFLQGIVGLMLGLMLLGGGAAVAMAHGSHASVQTASRMQASPPPNQVCTQDQADNGTESASENKADTDQVQDTTSRDPGTEASGQADTDNVNLQCGDQNGSDTTASSTQSGTTWVTGQIHALRNSLLTANFGHTNAIVHAQSGSPTASPATNEQAETADSESEANQGNDVNTDHVRCEQQGQHEGNNAGC